MRPSELIGRIRIDLHMSNSDQLVLVHDHHHEDDDRLGKDGPFDDYRSSTPGLATPSDEDQEQQQHHHHHHHDDDEAEKPEDATETASLSGSTPRLVDENDDGFRTPTSSDHKIPAMRQCPPAPRKPKPSAKRKLERSAARRSLIFDFSESEFESAFPSARGSNDQFVLKFKKPRRDIEEQD